jgi:WD40 repeat protein
VITASDDDTIKLWRASDGALLDTLTGHTDKVVTLAVSLSDGALASGALDGTIKIWDLHERRVVKEMRSKRRRGRPEGQRGAGRGALGLRLQSGAQAHRR